MDTDTIVDNNWCIVRVGGCIAEDIKCTHRYKGFKCIIHQDNMTKEQAQLEARQYNKMLSTGEKKYYGIHYYPTPMSKVKEVIYVTP